MKSLDKMTKDELKEMIKELKKENKEKENGDNIEELKKMLEEAFEEKNSEYKKREGKIREGFERLLKDSRCIIITTNVGTLQVGNKMDILSCVGATIQSLVEKKLINKYDYQAFLQTLKNIIKFEDEDETLDEEKILEELKKIFESL